ncbi:MAG: C25 family cysteine peptidase [Bacteroidota bacterium]
MKQFILYHILFLISFLPVYGQNFEYGNSWYATKADQPFVKLVVEDDGLYRVSQDDLTSAGYNVSQVNPQFIQLYYRGKEIPAFVTKKPNGQLDFIEFYGRRNDGRVDSVMYRDPLTGRHRTDLQPNKEVSLFTNESAYFLTWGSTPGRRYLEFFDPLYSLYSAEPSFRYEARKNFFPGETGSTYIVGGSNAFSAEYTLNSDYVTGEGYSGPAVQFNRPYNLPLSTPAAANIAGSRHEFKTRIFGRSNTQHILRIDLNNNPSGPVLDTALAGVQVYIRTYGRNYEANLGDVTDLTFNALKANTDNNHLCWASLTYDRLPDLRGDSTIRISDWNKPTPAYFRFSNVVGEDSAFVIDLNNPVRAKGLIDASGNLNVIVPGFGGERDLVVFTDRAIKKPRIEENKLSRLFEPSAGADFVIITHPSLESSANAYKAYRDTASNNPVSAKVVYVDQIYDEFGYGSITSWAIKRFCKYALDNWTVKPKYFLLWGKGRNLTRVGHPAMVPTYGYPATDYEFVSHFNQNSPNLDPEAAIGRVNVYDNDEGLRYLDKVKEYESTPWQSWMKEGVFLGGGANANEQNAISNSFAFMIDRFEDVPVGGVSHYFQKSTNTIGDPSIASYHDEISGGTKLIHFFGHSTSNILDISLRDPNEYTNTGRYPLMIAMGCYGGDFTGGRSFGEQWVMQPKKGSIGYIGNSSAGYLNPLRDYARVFYNEFYRKQRNGLPIGEVLKEVNQLFTDSLNNTMFRNHSRQLNLQGDPAISLYFAGRPDYEITESSILFDEVNFNAQEDSFEITLILDNLARAVVDSFNINIEQRIENGKVISHPIFRVNAPFLKDTVSFWLQNSLGNEITGQNVFEINIDAENEITELDESNNRVIYNIIVPGNIPANLFPTKFSLVGTESVELKASAFFIERKENVGYAFEIDTTNQFDSPLLQQSGEISGTSGFVSWQVPGSLLDSTVYYWRVRLTEAVPSFWGASSFMHIDNRKGWAQASLGQFQEDVLSRISIDEIQQRWDFDPISSDYNFSVRRGGGLVMTQNGTLIADMFLSGYSRNGATYTIIDPFSLDVKVNKTASGVNARFVRYPEEMYRMVEAINSADQGDYVLVSSNNNPRVPFWDEEVFEALKEIGASDNIRLLQDGDPFLIFGRKGIPNSAIEILAPNQGSSFVIDKRLLSNKDNGQVSSVRIGPAKSWDALYWDWKTLDPFKDELVKLSIFGVDRDSRDSLVLSTEQEGDWTIEGLNAQKYPFLRLEAELRDSVRRSAPQLNQWVIYYEPVPDVAVDPVTNFEFQADTVDEGQDIFIRMQARNISEIGMDSLLVKFSLVRNDRSLQVLDSIRIAPVPAGASVPFSYSFSTLNSGLEGEISLRVELNPNQDQQEQYVFNNLYVQPFYVRVDRFNPLLDVTFDGKRIINGDIVSPQPEIAVLLTDENTFTALDDTSSFELYLRKGNIGGGFERIFLTDPRVDWIPAELPENKARIFFYPGKLGPLPDDNYTLRVQGKDSKGNVAGVNEQFYEVNFEVVNESSVTHLLNYPNPFSTATRFVYTLTGNEMPEVFQIQIYSISGRQIKVIDLMELGEVRFGRNITEYAWDGTDDFGDRLDNGVYLYRVVTKMATEELNLRETGVEKYFKNGWGKMYLMR